MKEVEGIRHAADKQEGRKRQKIFDHFCDPLSPKYIDDDNGDCRRLKTEAQSFTEQRIAEKQGGKQQERRQEKGSMINQPAMECAGVVMQAQRRERAVENTVEYGVRAVENAIGIGQSAYAQRHAAGAVQAEINTPDKDRGEREAEPW